MGKRSGDKAIYNTALWVFIFVLIGIAAMAVSLVVGILIAHLVGRGADAAVSCAGGGGAGDVVPNFIGGVLGLSVGFIMDKICFDEIKHIIKFKSSMNVVGNELVQIKSGLNEYSDSPYARIREEIDRAITTLKSATSLKSFNAKKTDIKHSIEAIKAGCEKIELATSAHLSDVTAGLTDMDGVAADEAESAIDSMIKALWLLNKEVGQRAFANNENVATIRELIFDDFITSAERVSTIVELPFCKGFKTALIQGFGNVQKRIEEYNEAVDIYSEYIGTSIEGLCGYAKTYHELITGKRLALIRAIDMIEVERRRFNVVFSVRGYKA